MKTPLTAALGLSIAFLAAPNPVRAHCDTLDGPVVTDARQALAAGDVTPVLKWVAPGDEGVIRDAFERTRQVRSLAPEAQSLADLYFFETVVRIHRESEGAPYTGLKSDDHPEPGIELADRAIAAGSATELLGAVTEHARAGIQERFRRLQAAKAHADEGVQEGREYVEAYVDFIHYVKGIHEALASAGHHTASEHAPHN